MLYVQHIGFIDMETGKIIFLIVMSVLFIGIAYIAIRASLKEIKSRTFVYPKTGHKYIPLYKCKMKDFTTGVWKEAVIYEGVEDGNYYVREKSDFFNKFVKLLDWEDGKGR